MYQVVSQLINLVITMWAHNILKLLTMKKLTELLTDKLSEEILDELGIRLNAS